MRILIKLDWVSLTVIDVSLCCVVGNVFSTGACWTTKYIYDDADR